MKNKAMIEYTLTLNSQQAKETLKAVELLMRLKLNQYEELTRAVMPDDYLDDGKINKESFDKYIKHRDKANEYIKLAFQEIYPNWANVKKDEEWYRLYNIYQSLRYTIHECENPTSTGVDSYPPIKLTDEPVPECKWRKENNTM